MDTNIIQENRTQAVDNGTTLCVPCHKTTDTYGGKKQKQK
jgi:hypothetical protein